MLVKQKIKRFLSERGAGVCGIAAADAFGGAPPGFRPVDVYAGCRSVIVFGLALPRGLLRIESHAVYLKAMQDALAELDRLALLAGIYLERLGAEAVPLPSDDPVGFWDERTKTAKGVLSLKHAAELAGLGRIGKNTLLINPLYGNRLMLGAVLTDLKLEADAPVASLCPAGCRICLDNCPEQALDGVSLDQRRCRLLIYGRDERGQTINRCNRCRRLCPQALRRPPAAIRAAALAED